MNHVHELNNCAHYDYKDAKEKQTKNKHVRKGDMPVDEVRNIIIDGFYGFQEYMKMKLQPTEVED